MIGSATEPIPLLPQTVVTTMVMWKSSQWLGKKIVCFTGKRTIEL